MKRCDLLLGGGLAAVLIAGVVLTRGLGTGGGESPADLDLMGGDGVLAVGDVDVAVAATPRPLRVFDSLRFAFRFTRGGEPIEVDEPRIDFDMTMNMGPHEYRLVRDGAVAWVVEGVVLPQCGSGSRLWFGRLTFGVDGRPYTARLRMELAPPRTD